MIDFIINNINKLSNHNNIIDFLKKNNVPFSTNYNGFFLNLSILDKEILSNIVNIIKIDLNYKDVNLNINVNNKNPINIINHKILEKTSFTFTTEEWEIINHTKKKLY